MIGDGIAWDGIVTGEPCTAGQKYCEVQKWSPEESDADRLPVTNIDNLSLFFKVNIRFPTFGVDKTNAEDKEGTGFPTNGYNQFYLRQIVEKSGTTWEDANTKGAIILFT
eukprot:UN25350